MEKSEQKLIDTVESLAPEILDFTSRLVACPSTLGKEAPVLEVMENELSLLGFDPVRVEISPEDLADHPGFAPVPWDEPRIFPFTGFSWNRTSSSLKT